MTISVPRARTMPPSTVGVVRAVESLWRRQAAQGAKIDVMGGGTYTSDGYVTSLKSDLDEPGR